MEKLGFVSGARGYPWVEIIEQPASKAVRFRYECEGRSAGSVPGANSCMDSKTYPTIKIHNYSGRGVVVVSCVTKDRPYRPHPHNLVGRGICRSGVCHVELTPGNPLVSFVNLGIQCVKRKDVAESLKMREDIRVDPYKTGFGHKLQASTIDLNAVRLCFQVFIEGTEGRINVPLKPIVSDPIFDKKAMCDLVICKLSHYSASVAGGMEMIVLCEKIAKENIQVRFFEIRDGREVWEGYGDFSTMDVHKQVAISFFTPAYKYRKIEEPLQVYVQLKRPSDGVTSEPLPFSFLPLGANDPDSLKRKRRKFEESAGAQGIHEALRRMQTESQAMMLNEPQFEYVDATRIDAHVQAFPVGTMAPCRANNVQPGIQTMPNRFEATPSPLLDLFSYCQNSPLPANGYANFQVPPTYPMNNQPIVDNAFRQDQNNRIHGNQQQHQNLRQQLQNSLLSGYNENQQANNHRQDNPVLQKLSVPPQQTYQRNNPYQEDFGDPLSSDILDLVGHQPFSFDASLTELDSAELAAFGLNLSESFSSGLSITEHSMKNDNNPAPGTIPVGVGAPTTWCEL